MPTGPATQPTSLFTRSGQWIRALGIRCLILFSALMLTVPTAEVISTSNAFAQTRDPSVASVQQALAAALPSMTPPPPDATTTPPDVAVPPDVPPAVDAPAVAPASTPAVVPPVPVAPAAGTPAAAPTAVAVQSVPEVAAVQPPSATAVPAPAVTTDPALATTPASTTPVTTAPATSVPVSAAVRTFLAGLNIQLPDGPVSGTLNGSTLTVAVGAPALPITLPVGGHPLAFSGATLTIDEATKSLSLSGTATSDNGVTANLTVSIGNVSSTDLTGTGPTADLNATVTIAGVPVLGTVVDLTGTLSYTGGKPAASLTGTLAADAVVAANTLTIKSGSTLTLSTADGFMIDGQALVGSGDSVFTVGVKGEVHDPKTWSFDVSLAGDRSFTPVDGLTITPDFAGTITDTAGVVRFDLGSNETGSWTTGPVTVALQHVEVSNTKPAAGQACSAIADGNLWIDVKGSLIDDALKLNADAEACVNVSNKTFTITADAPNGLLPAAAGFSIEGAQLIVSRDTAGTVAVSATGTLNITAGLPAGTAPKPIAITVSFAGDGSFVATGSVNLADLKLGTGTAAVYVASRNVQNYAYGTQGDKIDLTQGVTLVLDAQPSTDVGRVFSYLKLPAPKAIRTIATLSPSGFTGTVAATFGPGTSGAQLLGKSTPGGATLNVNSLSLGVNLSATNASFSVSGSAYLTLPALYPGRTQGSAVQVSLTGSLSLTPDSVGVSLGFNLESSQGWQDAFGIPDMTVQQVAGTLGIKIGADTGGLPVPTLSFLVKDLQLPPALASVLGVTANTTISLSLAMDVDQPIVHFSIVGPNNGTEVALRPLSFAKNYPAISSAQNSIEIKKAEFLLAPLGGKDAAGKTVKAGATLVFDGIFGGVPAHVYANLGLTTPQFVADASVGSFAVGPVTFDSGSLHISVDPAKPEASFMLAGGFTDKVTNIRFGGKIELGASTQLANAAIALHIAGGQPSYLIAQADLQGRVSYTPSAGITFGASGSVRMYAANTVDLGNVSFSYSSSAGALWQQLSQAPNVVANTFRQIYGWTDVKIAQELKSLRFTANDVAKGIGQGLNETNAQVTAAMYRAGYTADQTVQAVRTWGNATLGDIATGLNQAGAKTDEIVAATKTAFGNSAATAYNTLQSIGQGGQSALASVANFFNPGTYYISNKEHWYDVPMFFDVYYSSQAPDTHVIQWTLNGGYNQQWYVLPTDSGYAEIVNRNSGQCLSVYGNNAGPAPLVQYPCFGGANQQWLFSGGTSNLGGSTGTLKSRSTGLMADVAGESATAGAWIDQWYVNGHNNQLFTFTNAIG